MDKEKIFISLSIILGITASFAASPLIYLWYFGIEDLSVVVLLPILEIILPTSLGISVLSRLREWEGALIGIHLFLALTAILSFLSIGNKLLMDSTPVKLQATFYQESGFDIFLRQDMTVKCIEMDIFSTTDKYGKYKLRGDTIILSNIDIVYGLSEVNDTMVLDGDKLIFKLDREWRRILEGQMHIKKNDLN